VKKGKRHQSQSSGKAKRFFSDNPKGITITQSGLDFSKITRLETQLEKLWKLPAIANTPSSKCTGHPNLSKVGSEGHGTGQNNVRYFRDIFNSFTERNYSMKDQSIMHRKPSESEDVRVGSSQSIVSSISPLCIGPLKSSKQYDSRRKGIFRNSTVRDSQGSAIGRNLTNLNSIDESHLEGLMAEPGELRIAPGPARGNDSFKIELNPMLDLRNNNNKQTGPMLGRP
jgi:hypothetical protein